MTHVVFKNVLFNFQIFGNFRATFLLFISDLIALWYENIHCVISFIRFGFWRIALFFRFDWFRISFSSFSLTLCVGVCALDKAGTSPSLHGLATYRTRLQQISPARGSGASNNSFPPQGETESLGFLSAHCVLSKGRHLLAQAL